MKILENLWQSSETFGKLRKRFKGSFQMFLSFSKIFRKSSEIFGSIQKSSEIFGKLRKRFQSNFQVFL